jgi:hypothetical protein
VNADRIESEPQASLARRAILTALDPMHDLSTEVLNVRLWRFFQLDHDSYGVEDAVELALAPHVDLQQARELVSRRGCPPRLAAQILL